MPVIKAYKSGPNLVPVDTAKIVKAFRCPWTHKLYNSKQSYVAHLSRLRADRNRIRNRNLRLQRMTEDLNSQPSWLDVIRWIDTNSHYFLFQAKSQDFNESANWPPPEEFSLRITFLELEYSECVSNSHSHPRNGVSNWARVSSIPDGYPGWEGAIEFTTSHALPTHASNIMRNSGIHTGTGGGRSGNRYGYSVRMFDADWPGPIKQRVLDILSDRKSRRFRWGTADYFR